MLTDTLTQEEINKEVDKVIEQYHEGSTDIKSYISILREAAYNKAKKEDEITSRIELQREQAETDRLLELMKQAPPLSITKDGDEEPKQPSSKLRKLTI